VAIDGVRLASVETAASVAATVAQWLLQLRAATGAGLRPQGAATRRLVERDLPGAFAFLGLGPQDPACASLRTHVEKALRSSSLPLSMAHGDLSVDNVLLDAGGTSVAGVFDWDLADPCAVPLLDLLYFVATILRRRRGWGIGRCFAALFDLDALEPELGGIVDGHRRALGVNRAAVAPLIVLAWAHHVARRIEPPEPYPWAHHRPDLVEPFVPVAIERLQAAERSTAA
jgi:aminoglycoside phosphotransferase (APT) family kinase protein